MYFQHGDVVIEKINSVPKGKRIAKKQKGYILAEGEATGHRHCVTEEIELIEQNGTLYIKARDSFTVTHEEHKPITVPAGDYEVRKVQEYSHFDEEARDVAD